MSEDRILNSKRLTLRPIRMDDAADYARLLGDDRESVMRMAVIPWPCTEDAVRALISQKPAHLHALAILTRPDDLFIGSVGLTGPHPIYQLGYWIGRPFWNRGYATEAVGIILKYARYLGAESIKSDTFPDNPASDRVLVKNGFMHIGQGSRYLPLRGGWRQMNLYMLPMAPIKAKAGTECTVAGP